MNPTEIQSSIESQFKLLLSDDEHNILPNFTKEAAYGHEAGAPLEEWVKDNLQRNGWKVFFPNEFVEEFFKKIGRNETRIIQKSKNIWWGSLLVSSKQIKSFMAGKPVKRGQQEGADIILFYGDDLHEDIEKVILINVKSHDTSRSSRAPNIMSAQRILEFFNGILKNDSNKLDAVELWFLGVGYSVTGNGAKISSIHIKDIFKIDVSTIPQINFDAAIQIQYHVKDMKLIDQDKITFVSRLSELFIKKWREHSAKKGEKYEKMVKEIQNSITQLKIR